MSTTEEKFNSPTHSGPARYPQRTECGPMTVEVHHPKCGIEVMRGNLLAEAMFLPDQLREALCYCETWEAVAHGH